MLHDSGARGPANHPACYGSLFPSVLAIPERGAVSGAVFAATASPAGGIGPSSRLVTIDLERWDGCLRCDDFGTCYKLSMATLAFETAVQNR